MSFKVLIYEETDGFWAKVPALPGCATQGDTEEELMANVEEAIRGWLSIDEDEAPVRTPYSIRELVFARP